MNPDPLDYRLPPSQTAVLARVYRLVALEGYNHWKLQTTPAEKITLALKKLHERHYVLLDNRSRSYRRQNGLPVAQAILAPAPQGGQWPLLLLSTQKLKGEEMWNVSRKPLEWPAWRTGSQQWTPYYRLEKDNTGRWSWSLTPEVFQAYLEEALAEAQAGRWDQVIPTLRRLGHLPSFRGIHHQRLDVLGRVTKIWGDRYMRTTGHKRRNPPWRGATAEWPARPISPLRVVVHGPALGEVLRHQQ